MEKQFSIKRIVLSILAILFTAFVTYNMTVPLYNYWAPAIFAAFLLIIINRIHLLRYLNFLFRVRMRSRPSTVGVIFVLIFILASSSSAITWQYNFYVANRFVDELGLELSDVETPFTQGITPDAVRLVDRDLAYTIAQKHKATFTASAVLGYEQIGVYQGHEAWYVPVIEETLNSMRVRAVGFIIIDVNKPFQQPTIIKYNQEATVMPDLLWYRNPDYKLYNQDQNRYYGRNYYTEIDGEIRVIVLSHNGFLYPHDAKVHVLSLDGKVIEELSPNEAYLKGIPQVLDEENYIEFYENAFSGFLMKDKSLDMWAGYLSEKDTFEPSEILRYLHDQQTGTTIAITTTHPTSNPSTMHGMFIWRGTNVTYHNLRRASFISADEAQREGTKIPQLTIFRSLSASMRLLYPIKYSDGTVKLAWFIPYTQSDRLVALAIVDPVDTSHIGYATKEEATGGEGLARLAMSRFSGVSVSGGSGNEIHGKIKERSTWIEDGNQVILFKVDDKVRNDIYVMAKANQLSAQDFHELIRKDTGDSLHVTATFSDSEQVWIITGLL